MATYAIGDIQGCYRELMTLLDRIAFGADDLLWLTGDLVNRGPDSLQVLRFVHQLGEQVQTVLGNHDLHLLAVHYGFASCKRKDTLEPILQAPDRDQLLAWLQRQPLLIDDQERGYAMCPPGIPPQWSLKQARQYAGEVEQVLNSTLASEYFRHMYGNHPDTWHDEVKSWERLRLITNYLTRMRFVRADGKLDFSAKGGRDTCPEGFAPWFDLPRERPLKRTLLFGHWAALGSTGLEQIIALDTGCIWGNQLTALRLEDGAIFNCDCRDQRVTL